MTSVPLGPTNKSKDIVGSLPPWYTSTTHWNEAEVSPGFNYQIMSSGTATYLVLSRSSSHQDEAAQVTTRLLGMNHSFIIPSELDYQPKSPQVWDKSPLPLVYQKATLKT